MTLKNYYYYFINKLNTFKHIPLNIFFGTYVQHFGWAMGDLEAIYSVGPTCRPLGKQDSSARFSRFRCNILLFVIRHRD